MQKQLNFLSSPKIASAIAGAHSIGCQEESMTYANEKVSAVICSKTKLMAAYPCLNNKSGNQMIS